MNPLTTPLSAHQCAVLHCIATEQLVRALSVATEVEGMKAANAQFPESQPHMEDAFARKAAQMRGFADYLSGCLSSHIEIAQDASRP